MGCCRGLCKILMMLWTIIAMIFSVAMIGFMAFKLGDFSKQEKNPKSLQNLLVLLPGSGWYESLNVITLTKFTWYAALGLATLMCISTIIHVISTCKKSRCLLGLSTLLLVLVLAADIAGLIFRFEAQNSIIAELETSLNATIVNQYGDSDHKAITDSWNLLGKEGNCCGINNGEDFLYAENWNGEINPSTAPCGSRIGTGCLPILRKRFISLDDIWFTALIGVKCLIIFLMLMHTLCVCKLGFHKRGSGSQDAESYTLVQGKN